MRSSSLSVLVLPAIGLCCAGPHRPADSRQTDPSRHWVHGDQLKNLMTELDQVSRAAWPQELEGQMMKSGMSETFATAARQADLLAGTARGIPESVDPNRLSVAERQAFHAIAETLFQQAGELAASARAGDLGAMHRVRAEINATCSACHERFRDVSGPM